MERDELIRIADEPLRLRRFLLPMVGLFVAAYFLYHVVESPQGLRTFMTNAEAIEDRQIVLNELSATRDRMERNVAMLRPESIDPDLLDERVRSFLGYMRPDELTIFRN
ncbi:MAG: septum formation initiator family protein [Parvibaculaceae bacterium]|nr:septum formation initiator family protein [Parvibaculaceae bacterium]